MKTNMGNADKLTRLMSAVIIATLYFTNVISGTLAIVLFILAAIFVVTSIVGFCPLYYPFKFSTVKKEK